MAGIEDCSSKCPLRRHFKSGGRQQADSKPQDADQGGNKENHVPEILAKASIAAKMQIVAGTEPRDQSTRHPEDASCGSEDSGCPGLNQPGFNEEVMIQNLKSIAADENRWNLFALGALGLQPGSKASDTVRGCLFKDFKQDGWDGIKNMVSLYANSVQAKENADHPVSSDGPLDGLIERTQLWLTFPDYYETLFNAVKENNLSSNINLYTDDLLIKYLGTIGQ